jgi:hypothetical protein
VWLEPAALCSGISGISGTCAGWRALRAGTLGGDSRAWPPPSRTNTSRVPYSLQSLVLDSFPGLSVPLLSSPLLLNIARFPPIQQLPQFLDFATLPAALSTSIAVARSTASFFFSSGRRLRSLTGAISPSLGQARASPSGPSYSESNLSSSSSSTSLTLPQRQNGVRRVYRHL